MHTYFMDRLVEWKPEYDAAAGEKVFLGRPDEVRGGLGDARARRSPFLHPEERSETAAMGLA